MAVILLPGNATPDKVLSGYSFSAGSNYNTMGTMPNNGSPIWTPGTSNQNIAAGYYSGGTIQGDSNLVSGNIKKGVSIFGVAGTANPTQDRWLTYGEVSPYSWTGANTVSGSGAQVQFDGTHGYIYMYVSGTPGEVVIATTQMIDFTGCSQIIGSYSCANSAVTMYVVLSTTQIASYTTYNYRAMANWKQSQTLNINVGSISGSYYVRIHCVVNSSSGYSGYFFSLGLR
jgi:hypothetical protein